MINHDYHSVTGITGRRPVFRAGQSGGVPHRVWREKNNLVPITWRPVSTMAATRQGDEYQSKFWTLPELKATN